MRNKIGDLNNYLFEALERINDDELDDEQLAKEIKRANSVTQIADKIIEINKTSLSATKMLLENGVDVNYSSVRELTTNAK